MRDKQIKTDGEYSYSSTQLTLNPKDQELVAEYIDSIVNLEDVVEIELKCK